MLDLKSILRYFGLFVVLFSAILAFASTDGVERRLGQWFISSASGFFEWSLSEASINIEHDRNLERYNPNEVWISPVGKAWLQEQIQESQRSGSPLEIDNEASLLFKIGTFPKTSLVFLLSLVLATPLQIKQKLKSLAIALLAFAAYFYLFIYFDVLFHIAMSRIGVYELDGTTFKFVAFMKRTFCNFGFSLSFALLVWAVTCVDFNALFAQFNMAVQGKPQTKSPGKGTKLKKKRKSKKKN